MRTITAMLVLRISAAFLWLAFPAPAGAATAQSPPRPDAPRHTPRDVPPPAPRELRGAWVATVANIDWPSSKRLSTAQQQAELVRILDAAQQLRLNALIFQVRPACDALYRSELEPWSEFLTGAQGRAPDPLWDPLRFVIDGCRERGLELHAWFNPFRARHHRAESPDSADHVAVRHREWVVTYGNQLWLDPGIPEARAHSLRVMLDVVERYDVDGVHIDDYFYPYPVGGKDFPDDASFRRYRDGGGRLRRDDWRRHNVDSIVETLYREIHRKKRWVLLGISPFGIARPGVPEGIEAGVDQFADLYADPVKWLAEGWCDYMAPQLYWPITQKPQSYATLLRFWSGQNPRRRHLVIGNNTSRAVAKRKPWGDLELLDQIALTREEAGAVGNIHFSMRVLRDDTRRVASVLRSGPYRTRALVPASRWLDAEPPTRPTVRLDRVAANGLAVRWQPDPDARLRCVWVRSPDRWRLVAVVPGHKPGLRLTADELTKLQARSVAVTAVDRSGNEGSAAVARMPR